MLLIKDIRVWTAEFNELIEERHRENIKFQKSNFADDTKVEVSDRNLMSLRQVNLRRYIKQFSIYLRDKLLELNLKLNNDKTEMVASDHNKFRSFQIFDDTTIFCKKAFRLYGVF